MCSHFPAGCASSEVSVLLQLKAAWGTWAGNSNATTACSAWTGITCSPRGLVVALGGRLFSELDPPANGSIPASITTLAALQYLDLTYNIDPEGPIPSLATLTGLTHLQQADWHSGRTGLALLPHQPAISGSSELGGIHWGLVLPAHPVSPQKPSAAVSIIAVQNLNVDDPHSQRQGRLLNDDISHLAALTSLSLHGNNLEGYLTNSWTSLVHLQQLNLGANKFQGTIPATFSALTELTAIDLSYNQLSGTIPPAFATSVQSILLGYNNFSGPIPPQLGELPYLAELQLSHNQFTGAIPTTFTRLSGMYRLDISSNNLTSGLDVVAQMPWLNEIWIANNSFSGVIPSSFTAISSLFSLDVGNNHFIGTFPGFILQQEFLFFLNLANNSFTGTIPHELTKLVRLGHLYLKNNNFHGAIPFGLLRLPKLFWLDVSHNSLSGELPRALTVSQSLHMLGLGGNGFTGSLPDFSRWNVSCEQINLSGNNLTGSIPDSISTLTSLIGFFLNNNQLTGTIPSAIFTMRNLTYIYLANNHLTGSLPHAISQLENLEQIRSRLWSANTLPVPRSWLDNNKIEGPLPTALCSLPWLWRFMMSNNYLYGALPDCFFSKCISHIDVSGNSLYGRINRDFENIAADDSDLINLSHNFFFGDGALFAAGCKVCPTEVSEPNSLGIRDTTAWQNYGGKCGSLASSVSVAGAGKRARVSLSGNCLTLTPSSKCSANATQRSTAACQAFCSMTDLGPCDGHGACVPADPASPSNFTCLCDAGYSAVNSANASSTCAIVHSTTTTVSSLSTGAIVGIVLGSFAGFSLLAAVLAWLLWPRGPSPLSLRQRLRLAQGAAEGLAYLHGFETAIVHRDIKPANILVTADMQAKVADFGLLKRLTHGDADATRVAGTPGYVDPDYNRTNVITTKSDVFSFGIVLLELLSGKSARIDAKTHIRKWAVKLVEAYELEELRDSKMPAASEEAIVDFADLALDCIKSPGTRRPTMKDVAYRLNALIAKHCPAKEDEWESIVTEESANNEGMSSSDVSAASFEDSGRESGKSRGSQSGVSAFMRAGSIGDGLKGWLQLKPATGR
ncbi:unnamed protein product [Closterium sp. Yama58-4]|nr:unnamed protein product [Closterium sp. Yama58-4]